MQKILLKLKHGAYELVVVQQEGYVDIFVKKDNENAVYIYANNLYKLFDEINSGRYSLVEFEIQTVSKGSLNVNEMKKHIEMYQKAIDAVEVFESSLKVLESLSK